MKIANASLQMASTHASQQRHEVRENLRAWIGDRRPDLENGARQAAPARDPVQLSTAGKTAQSSEAGAAQDSTEASNQDSRLQLLIAMVEAMTGRKVKVFDAAELQAAPASGDAAPAQDSEAHTADPAAQAAGYGVEYERHESYTETEQTDFAASGVVRTAGGREISFNLSLSMARSYHEGSDASLRLGDATRNTKDPLVLNFNGKAAQLTSQRFKFDLDADGSKEEINFVAGGSGFLALDRNGDGKINDGSELFGARSGDGFQELAALDSDHNGWIDENDPAFKQLRVWTKDNAGQDQLTTLGGANVGALSLGRIVTPFDLKDGGNALQGKIRSSGIFLQESGGAGTMQQIDLTV